MVSQKSIYYINIALCQCGQSYEYLNQNHEQARQIFSTDLRKASSLQKNLIMKNNNNNNTGG